MKKNGFTLVEILAVLVIVAAIATISVPSIINYINNKKNEVSEVTKKIIFSGAELYVDNNDSVQYDVGYYDYCVQIKDIINSGFLEAPIIDSKSGDEIDLNKYVKITSKYDTNLKKYKENYEIVTSCNPQYYSCIMESNDNRNIEVGTEVTCGTEQFYVIPDHKLAGEGTVSLLAKYNLNIDTNSQSKDNPSNVTFSGSVCDYNGKPAYWKDQCPGDKPCWVYNENSNLYQYVEKYNNYLKQNGMKNSVATLIYYDLVNQMSNGINVDNNVYYGKPNNHVDLLFNMTPTYWTGDSSYNSCNEVVHVHASAFADEQGSICGGANHDTSYGIRPVIIIPKTDINNK